MDAINYEKSITHHETPKTNGMKIETKQSVIACLAALVAATSVSQASPAAAEDDAYEMAVRQSQAGFTIFPGSSGSLQANEKTRLLMPVTAGVTYAFLVGVDERVADIELYVLDEFGNEIVVDERRQRRAGAMFRANYTGTAEVYIVMRSARRNRATGKEFGIASWALLVGTRGGPTQERRPPVGAGDANESARDADPVSSQDLN